MSVSDAEGSGPVAQGERAGSQSEATSTEGRFCYLLSDFPLVHSFPSSMKQVNDTSASSGSMFKQEQCTGRRSIRSTCPSAQVQASSPDSQVHCPPPPAPLSEESAAFSSRPGCRRELLKVLFHTQLITVFLSSLTLKTAFLAPVSW